MEFGVVLLDADEHLNKPAENDIKDMLRRTATTPSARVLDTWQRQQHVLSVKSEMNMQLHLYFQRPDINQPFAVGVDDLHLFPVLSRKTRVAEQSLPSLLFPHGGVCALIHVPSLQELNILGLAHLYRGNQSIAEDNWERLHLTVAITTKPEAVGCQFTATLFSTLDVDVCTQDISQLEEHKRQLLGCFLTPSGFFSDALSYAQCTIEVPAFLAGAKNLAVSVRHVVAAQAQAQDTCALQHETELVVSLRPHTLKLVCRHNAQNPHELA